jgi:hypothetical protein
MKIYVYTPIFSTLILNLLKKELFLFLKREEILLSIKPIYRIQSYGILVSFKLWHHNVRKRFLEAPTPFCFIYNKQMPNLI